MSQSNLLNNIYLFKGLGVDELEIINDISEEKTFLPGDDVFSEKDQALGLFVIKFGSIKIHIKGEEGDNIEVANLGTGSHFGEMAFLDGENRSASATAIEKTDIVQLNYDKLKQVLDSNQAIAIHFYRELAKFLCGRLRVTTNDLSFAREQNLSHF